MAKSRLSTLANESLGTDPFGPYAPAVEPARLVELEVPPGWRVRVVEGTEFQVRVSSIEAESDDDGDSVSPNQSRGP